MLMQQRPVHFTLLFEEKRDSIHIAEDVFVHMLQTLNVRFYFESVEKAVTLKSLGPHAPEITLWFLSLLCSFSQLNNKKKTLHEPFFSFDIVCTQDVLLARRRRAENPTRLQSKSDMEMSAAPTQHQCGCFKIDWIKHSRQKWNGLTTADLKSDL